MSLPGKWLMHVILLLGNALGTSVVLTIEFEGKFPEDHHCPGQMVNLATYCLKKKLVFKPKQRKFT